MSDYPNQPPSAPGYGGFQYDQGASAPPPYAADSPPAGYGYETKGGYAAPPPPFVGPQNVNVTVQSQPIVVPVENLGRQSTMTYCNHCHSQITTSVHHEASGETWLICFGLWFIGLGFGCCLIPFCVDECQRAVHTCPNCNATLGSKDAF
ncbi:lipopolysaccharide-induced tumor necrosis factor-alpha factor homolog [Symsagittifera roscoffensis]|uniref:lipopolysaccharide-induced tumor necrosis factor-alpha factor homolog n=1 Tax=Symsagittifera roscoffensis TaxID=84072 RepID=UPI00307BDD00